MQHHYHPPLYLSYYIYTCNTRPIAQWVGPVTPISPYIQYSIELKNKHSNVSAPTFGKRARDCFGGCFLQRIFVCLDDCIVNGMSDCKLSDFNFVLNLLAEKLKKKNVLPI